MAWYLYIVRTSTIAKNRHLNLVLQAELYLQTPLDRRGMPSLQSNSIFSFKHHLRQARHGQLAEQFYLFIQTPLATGEACLAWSLCCPSVSAHPANCIRCSSNIAIADHFPSKTFSVKHHLTGEAWPACSTILPFHSNTT